MVSEWLRDPTKRAQAYAYALLAVAVLWAGFRIARSLQILFSVSHDGFMYYSLWYVMAHRDMADIALRQSLYLPHTWLFLTPFFLFGWPVARLLLLLLNVGAVVLIWRRLCGLSGLEGVRRWLLLGFFCSWLSTGLVIGLGNLALVCLAAILTAYPFRSSSNVAFLALSAMKQSLVFPVYFHLLLKKPKMLIMPFAVFAVSGLLALLWAHMSVLEGFQMVKGWSQNVSTWTQADHTSLRPVLGRFLEGNLAVTAVTWGIWFALFGLVVRLIKDPFTLFAALMLLCFLPMYHNVYDLVAAIPALAVFLRRCSLIWPSLLTLALSVNVLAPLRRLLHGTLAAVLDPLFAAYYPVVILLALAGLVLVERRTIQGHPEAGPVPESRELEASAPLAAGRVEG